jgi:hypothetical protein
MMECFAQRLLGIGGSVAQAPMEAVPPASIIQAFYEVVAPHPITQPFDALRLSI